jgi:hypothetical protein
MFVIHDYHFHHWAQSAQSHSLLFLSLFLYMVFLTNESTIVMEMSLAILLISWISSTDARNFPFPITDFIKFTSFIGQYIDPH